MTEPITTLRKTMNGLKKTVHGFQCIALRARINLGLILRRKTENSQEHLL